MLDTKRIFDVSQLETDIEEAINGKTDQNPHDPFRPGTVHRRPSGAGAIGTEASPYLPPRPSDDRPAADPDPVNHPPHYLAHPSGVECIAITEWMNFCLGNAVKYIWRAAEKGNQIQDLEKARWYLTREIERLSH